MREILRKKISKIVKRAALLIGSQEYIENISHILTMQNIEVLNPSSCWLPTPDLAFGSHTTGVDKSKPIKYKYF